MSNKIRKAVIREDLLSITSDFREAIILNQFIYWSERVSDADVLIEKENEIAKNNGEEEKEPFYGWIYKTADELAEEIMLGLSASQVRRYINKLVECGYVAKRNNPKYKWDRTLQYKVNLVNIARALKKNGYPLSDYKISLPDDEKCNTHTRTMENEPVQNQERVSEHAIPEITTENTDRDYNADNKYAFSEDKSSSKVSNIYAFSPEEKEVCGTQKQNRFIPVDYSYKELREHIRPVYESVLKDVYGCTADDTPIEDMLDITEGFYRLYKQEIGIKHRVLSDKAYMNLVDAFMNPPEIMDNTDYVFDYKSHMDMAKLYFKTDYNKQKKFTGNIEKSISHFMADMIRGNLFLRACYYGEE